MIKVYCRKCGKQLKEPGALIISPPETKDKVYKLHICLGCYIKDGGLMDWFTNAEMFGGER